MTAEEDPSIQELTDPAKHVRLSVSGRGAQLTLAGLVEKESYWRRQLGDEGYDQALRYWKWIAGTISR